MGITIYSHTHVNILPCIPWIHAGKEEVTVQLSTGQPTSILFLGLDDTFLPVEFIEFILFSFIW